MTETGESAREDGEAPRSSRARRLLAALLAGALALVLVHALLVEVFAVSGTSMDPLLKDGERVLVLKAGDPERGELVVFKNPDDPAQNVIKRVVARGGDRVAIRSGVLTVNGKDVEEPYLVHPADRDGSINAAETTLAPGALYVLGDNRALSVDSRRFGPVEASHLVGRAVLVLWPLRRL